MTRRASSTQSTAFKRPRLCPSVASLVCALELATAETNGVQQRGEQVVDCGSLHDKQRRRHRHNRNRLGRNQNVYQVRQQQQHQAEIMTSGERASASWPDWLDAKRSGRSCNNSCYTDKRLAASANQQQQQQQLRTRNRIKRKASIKKRTTATILMNLIVCLPIILLISLSSAVALSRRTVVEAAEDGSALAEVEGE